MRPGVAAQVSRETGVPEADVYGVASFYTLLSRPGGDAGLPGAHLHDGRCRPPHGRARSQLRRPGRGVLRAGRGRGRRVSFERCCPVGTPGEPWTAADRAAWLESQTVQRSYRDEVWTKLERLERSGRGFEVSRYGALPIDPERYPLFAVHHTGAGPDAPWALVTGGVHGYETSGVQGALSFLAGEAESFFGRLNLLVVPCVSPWGYEVVHRWNPAAEDPNRSFFPDSPAEESAALMDLLAIQISEGARFFVHVDLHETTDSDESEFRPALAACDGKPFEPGHIPDGFYTVGDTENPQPEFQAAVVAGVEEITHIAEADEKGEIIGSPVIQRGVILYPFRDLGLCAGVTDAPFTTTTEVYPDSVRTTPEECNAAQVVAVCVGLSFAFDRKSL